MNSSSPGGLQRRYITADEGFFFCPAQTFDAIFQAQRRGTIPGGTLEYEFDGCSSAQVFCAPNAVTMLFETARNVERDAGIETAVCTAKNVQAVTHENRQSGVSALEGIAQHAESPDLHAGQVFLRLGK